MPELGHLLKSQLFVQNDAAFIGEGNPTQNDVPGLGPEGVDESGIEHRSHPLAGALGSDVDGALHRVAIGTASLPAGGIGESLNESVPDAHQIGIVALHRFHPISNDPGGDRVLLESYRRVPNVEIVYLRNARCVLPRRGTYGHPTTLRWSIPPMQLNLTQLMPVYRLLLALFLSAATVDAQNAELSRGPYLQLGHEHGITVVWRTASAMKAPQVVFWQEGSEKKTTVNGSAILTRTVESEQPLFKAPKGTVQYEATILRLTPLSSYRYVVQDGSRQLHEPGKRYRFATHPVRGKPTPVRMWVVGDSGTGALHQRLVHEAMLQYTATTERPLDLYLHVGDMAYEKGTDQQFQKRFFAPYAQTLSGTVCWAAMGNHEGGTSNGKTEVGPFFDAYVCPKKGEAGGLPSGRESFFSFDYGDVHFIVMNSYDINRKPDGAMAKWLVKDLAATKARWIIGYWHHPAYTMGTHNSDTEKELVEMREHIMPILEDGGVDLVLSGHSHIYERSMLIDGAYQTPTTAEGVIVDDRDGRPNGDGPYRKSEAKTPHNGTVAVTTGHGGKLGANSKAILPIMRSIVLDYGSTILDVDGNTLTGIMVDFRGKERDRFAIVKRGTVVNKVVKDPWTPTKETEERTGPGVKGSPEEKPKKPKKPKSKKNAGKKDK